MALDHYVPQVHLRRFYSRSLEGQMHVIRKSDLRQYNSNSRNACGINDGSTNMYLENPRVIEMILEEIEPRYNRALEQLADARVSSEGVFAIAGFVTYVMTCSPAGGRIFSEPLRRELQADLCRLEKRGELPRPPDAFEGRNPSELLERGAIRFVVDPKYAQSIGIRNFLRFVNLFGNSFWETLINACDDCPFFTSDYPVALEPTANPAIVNRIIPLTPNLAVRILPDPLAGGRSLDFSFPNFRGRTRTISRHEAVEINRRVVQCAEDSVFYCNEQEWVAEFVKKNRNYRIEVEGFEQPTDEGYFLFFRQQITRFDRD
jgi:hypothetical protein